jgi:hypothetical protein
MNIKLAPQEVRYRLSLEEFRLLSDPTQAAAAGFELKITADQSLNFVIERGDKFSWTVEASGRQFIFEVPALWFKMKLEELDSAQYEGRKISRDALEHQQIFESGVVAMKVALEVDLFSILGRR